MVSKTTEGSYLRIRAARTAEAARKISAKAAKAFGVGQSQDDE
jgi:hypothetical protein